MVCLILCKKKYIFLILCKNNQDIDPLVLVLRLILTLIQLFVTRDRQYFSDISFGYGAHSQGKMFCR